VRVEPYEVKLGAPNMNAISTADLMRDSSPNKSAELQWRLSMPVSAILLVLLAIPLSAFNPRSGRGFHLVAALLIYMIYNNLLSIAQAWGQSGKVAPWAGVWSVHLLMLVLTTMFYYRRQTVAPLLHWMRK
jgi:lipopolysaccharide export system permease protein